MYIQSVPTRVVVHTPAKLNLFLEVLARRADGFHEIETLMTAIGLYDTLVVQPRVDNQIVLQCNWASGAIQQDQADSPNPLSGHGNAGRSLEALPAGAQNIVVRAVELLRKRFNVERGIDIQLTKRIPAAAGLGGASSDAAAALVAANLIWGLQLSRAQLAELSAEIGSDIPFFFGRGAAICRGRGEQIEATEPVRLQLVVVRPPEGLSTPAVYRQCKAAEAPISVAPLKSALASGNTRAAAQLMLNRLQAPAAELSSWIGQLQKEFDRLDLLGHQMSGSGSSYFGICHHAKHARRTAARLRARRLGSVFAAATVTCDCEAGLKLGSEN